MIINPSSGGLDEKVINESIEKHNIDENAHVDILETMTIELWEQISKKMDEKILAETNKIWGYTWLMRPYEAKGTGEPVMFTARSTMWGESNTASLEIKYSDTITLDDNGKIILANPIGYSQTGSNNIDGSFLNGKFFTIGNQYTEGVSYTQVYYFEEGKSTISALITNEWFNGTKYRMTLTLTDVYLVSVSTGQWSYIFSNDINTYPNERSVVEECFDGILQGTEYEFFGSVAKNSISYYSSNPSTILNTLLEFEDTYGV